LLNIAKNQNDIKIKHGNCACKSLQSTLRTENIGRECLHMKKAGVNVEKVEKNAKICFFCQFSIPFRNIPV